MAENLQQLLAEGIACHQAGRIEEAQRAYQKVLSQNPRHPDALRLLGVLAYQLNQFDMAAQLITSAIDINPLIAEYHANLGLALQALGRTDQAIEAFRMAISLKPAPQALADAHYNLANILKTQGKLDEAIAGYHAALVANPNFAEAHNNLGNAQKSHGNLAAAIAAYRAAIVLNANLIDVRNNLGNALKAAGDLDAAVAEYRHVVRLNPEFAEGHYNLGNALQSRGEFAVAIAAYREALRLKPDLVQARINLGKVLQDAGNLEDAIATLAAAVRLRPEIAEAHNNLGNALRAAGDMLEAIAAYRNAVLLSPDFAEAHNNLGSALKDAGSLTAAVASLRAALAIRPHFAEAHYNLGNAFKDSDELDAAVASYRTALALDPAYADACNNLANVLKEQGLLDEALALYQKAVEINPALIQAGSNRVYTLHFHHGATPASIAAELAQWHRRHIAGIVPLPPRPIPRAPAHRIRIGYISPDFRQHPIGRFLLPLFKNHDHTRFEIFAYSDVLSDDDITRRLRAGTDHWRSIIGMTDRDVARHIRTDEIDILVDLTMHMQGSRLRVFAHKPAPVQVTYLAYCSTTGMASMDYRLTDPHLDPRELATPHYAEKSVPLESYWCYEAPSEAPEVNLELPSARAGYITFGSLNNFCKISPPCIATWAKILQAVPASRLLIHARPGSHRDHLVGTFSAAGIAPERIEFVTNLPLEEYFQSYHRIDIALDTFPYTGGTTTCDALYMGVPVITLAPANSPAIHRSGLSLLSNIVVPELIAGSLDEYLRKAVDFASNAQKLTTCRRTLRQRMQLSVLMDGLRFSRSVEACFNTMVQKQ